VAELRGVNAEEAELGASGDEGRDGVAIADALHGGDEGTRGGGVSGGRKD